MIFEIGFLLLVLVLSLYMIGHMNPNSSDSDVKETEEQKIVFKTKEELLGMTKKDIAEYASEHNIRLDRRKKKEVMVQELLEQLP